MCRAHLLQACCGDKVTITSTSQVSIESKDLSRKAPLLLTELVIVPEDGSFTYSTSLETIHSKILTVFDRALTKLQVSGW